MHSAGRNPVLPGEISARQGQPGGGVHLYDRGRGSTAVGMPRNCLDSGERRNPHLDTAARSPLDKCGKSGLDRGLSLESIRSMPREVGSASYLHLVRNHVSSRKSPEWWPHVSGGARRSGR